MTFLKAISHPYSLINFIPSIISVQILILSSLWTLTYLSRFEEYFPTRSCKGIIRIAIVGQIIPGHPNLLTKMINTPMIKKGIDIVAKMVGPLSSIKLKSFERMLMIFPSYCDLAVYWERLVSLWNMALIKADLTLETKNEL